MGLIGCKEASVVILGAGPAGLTAAYELSNQGIPCVVLERDAVVGGLSRTVDYKGFRFDIGGHRFYTKVSLVEEIWREILGADLLTCSRLSRIYYKSKFFRYPLEPLDAFRQLGWVETLRCGLSFARSRAFPEMPEEDFETWVSNRFGRRLFETFFKSLYGEGLGDGLPRDWGGVGGAADSGAVAVVVGARCADAWGATRDQDADQEVSVSAAGAGVCCGRGCGRLWSGGAFES